MVRRFALVLVLFLTTLPPVSAFVMPATTRTTATTMTTSRQPSPTPTAPSPSTSTIVVAGPLFAAAEKSSSPKPPKKSGAKKKKSSSKPKQPRSPAAKKKSGPKGSGGSRTSKGATGKWGGDDRTFQKSGTGKQWGGGGGGGTFKNANKGGSSGDRDYAFKKNADTWGGGYKFKDDNFSGNVRPTRGGGGGDRGSEGGFGVRMITSKYDLMDPYDNEEVVAFQDSATLQDVNESLMENFALEDDELGSVEYYVNRQWKPLNDLAELKGKKAVPIRNPEYFGLDDIEGVDYDDDKDGDGFDEFDDDDLKDADDDDDDDDDDDLKDDDDDDDDADDFDDFAKYIGAYDDDVGQGSTSRTSLATQIRTIVTDLQKKGYNHSASTAQLISKNGEIVATKDYIMEQAMGDEALQQALVSQVGCLDHIVQCIHFPFFWPDSSNESEK